MKKLKINLLAIIGMMVAVATLAFTAPKETALADYNWYEADETTGAVNPDPIDPDATCAGTEELCAIGLSRDHFDLMPNDEAPIENLSELAQADEPFTQTVEKD